MTREHQSFFGKARQFTLALLAASSVNGACLAGTERILYDVDFDGPPHVLGMEPAYGFGSFPREAPTEG